MAKNDGEFYTFRGYQLLKQNKKNLTASMEDYMEMIYRQCKEEGYVRINSLARQLNVSAPSASKNVQKLARLGLISYEKYGIIQLTGDGREMGEFLLNRHRVLEAFLVKIGVRDSVLKDTEMIEHHISMETFRCIEVFNDFLEQHPDIVESFEKYRGQA
ncbi:MAG: iron dependent repressor, metal binding and dimerization domain protein [Bacillota bacterium]|nr:iron dependent repressor, metal binding and dimerization domain protein [Bacillota bacterium]